MSDFPKQQPTVQTAGGSLTENVKLFSKREQTNAKHCLTWTPTNWQPAPGIDRLSIRWLLNVQHQKSAPLWPSINKTCMPKLEFMTGLLFETMCIQWQRIEMHNPILGPQNLDTWAKEKSNMGWWVIFSLLLNLGFQIQLEKDKGFFSSAMSVTNWQIWWWRGSLCIMVHWKTFSITANFCQNLLVSFTIHKEMASNRYFNNLTTCFIYKVYKSLMVLKSTHV